MPPLRHLTLQIPPTQPPAGRRLHDACLHCQSYGTARSGAALCFSTASHEFIIHERQARSLRPRRDTSLPNSTQRWWQVAQRVWSESNRDNLSVVAAGCAFFALVAIFPALSALIALYGLTADPATVEQHFGLLRSVLPPQARDVVMEQIHRISAASGGTLGWSLAVSLGLALWSATAGTQAMMAALNIAYEEPERRSFSNTI